MDPDQFFWVWYLCMCAVACLNVLLCAFSLLQKSRDHYQSRLKLLSLVYVIGCGLRTVLPRIDVERICLFNLGLISSTFVGRIGATFAELALMYQLVSVFKHISADVLKAGLRGSALPLKARVVSILRFADLLFYANVIAQTLCWLGVTTTYQLWHVFEESIWTVSVTLLSFSAPVLARCLPPRVPSSTRRFLQVFPWFGAIYVLFMLSVDIPMYYNRWVADQAYQGHLYFSVPEGIRDSMACRIATASYDVWKQDMPWITGYFSAAVWASLWMGYVAPHAKA